MTAEMEADSKSMSSSNGSRHRDALQHEYRTRLDGPYFYRVTSEHSATTLHARSARVDTKCLFQSAYPFHFSHLSPECIEEHLRINDTRGSPFISVFDDFAEALRQSYTLYLRGHEAIQIIQLDASGLIETFETGTGRSKDAVIPIWQGNQSNEDVWLRMRDIGPFFELDPTLMRPSEWLACGSVPVSRFTASWPVIAGKLYFEEKCEEEMVELLRDCLGRKPEYVKEREEESVARYEYDWTEGRFVELVPREESGVASYGGMAMASVGLNPVSSIFALPTWLGYAGYLRGMIVMDS